MSVVHGQAIRREGFRKRRAALGLPPGDTDPYFDTMDDSEWQVGLFQHMHCFFPRYCSSKSFMIRSTTGSFQLCCSLAQPPQSD